MERPITKNLTKWITGKNINVFEKADAVIEYNKLLDYIIEKEQLILSGVVEQSEQCCHDFKRQENARRLFSFGSKICLKCGITK